ncbi:MAG TPA: ISLre2 family transposase [Leptolyngbyaceae cyanobacterium]
MNSNKNIPATLDLAQSLQHFQQSVAQVMELGDVSQWDGTILKAREQQIRQAALILAGQCIALLLHSLAQDREAHVTACKQTQGWRTPSSIGDGSRRVQVLTLGNVVVPLWLPYVVERRQSQSSSSAGKRRKVKGQGFYPFLRWLSMDDHLTPLVWSTLAQYGMLTASFAAARDSLQAWGITMSLKRIQRLTYRFGQVGLFRRQQGVNQLRQGSLPTTSVLKDQRVVISVDGGRTRIRRDKKGKPRQTTNRHGYYGDWTEPKLLTIYVVDEQGKRVNTASLPVTNDGTFGEVESFIQLLEMYLVRLGINQAKQVLLLADGAEWIWLRIPPLLKRLGCPPECILELLDFYHAAEHLQQFADAAFTEPAVCT